MEKPPALRSVLEKFNRANEYVDQLNAITQKFRDGYPDAVVPEVNRASGEVSYRVAYVPSVPDDVPLILGDALQNLRSTLDHLAYELVIAAKNTPTSNTAFPIFDSADDYWEHFARKVKGMGQHAIQHINRSEPYQGGFGHRLWQLHRLNNFDKHRTLLTTPLVNVARSITPSEEREFKAGYERRHGPRSSDRIRLVGSFSNRSTVPLKTGDVLHTVSASEADQDMKFPFDVAIDETGIAEGVVLFILLGEIRAAVHQMVENLTPCLY